MLYRLTVRAPCAPHTAGRARGTTGALRIVADQHWASDVLVGAAVGTFSGLAVPYFLHYGWGEPEEQRPDEVSISILPLPTGGMLSGAF